MKKIVVTAATGNIGSKLVKELLSKGHQVVAVTRTADKAKALAEAGALIAEGQMDDAQFLTKTFTGAAAVFALIPPEYTAENFRGRQNVVGDAIARAIVSAGVDKVVNLSSLGAEHSTSVGPIKGLYDQEQRLNAIKNIDLVHLRAAYFYENTFFGAHLVSGQSIFGTAVKPEVTFPHVATADIAKLAAELLTGPVHLGIRIVEAISESKTSMQAVTAEISRAVNKPVSYIAFPYDATKGALVGAGLSPDVADQFVELYDAMNRGLIHSNGFLPQSNSSAIPFRSFVEGAKAAFGA
jgi:uncharacterized protein YbjT (DUF2867 family)